MIQEEKEKREVEVIGLRVAGYSQQEIADMLGVHISTIKRDMTGIATGALKVAADVGKVRLSKAVKAAIDAVLDIASDPTHKDRLQAARTILQCTGLLSNIQVTNNTLNVGVPAQAEFLQRLTEVMAIRTDAPMQTVAYTIDSDTASLGHDVMPGHTLTPSESNPACPSQPPLPSDTSTTTDRQSDADPSA